MAESQSRVVELQQLDWAGVKANVDFAYTGTVALWGEFFSYRRRPRSPWTSRPVLGDTVPVPRGLGTVVLLGFGREGSSGAKNKIRYEIFSYYELN